MNGSRKRINASRRPGRTRQLPINRKISLLVAVTIKRARLAAVADVRRMRSVNRKLLPPGERKDIIFAVQKMSACHSSCNVTKA